MIRYLFLFLFALSVAAQTTTSPRTVNLPADLANVPIPITPPATRLTAILLGSVTVGDSNAGTFYWDYSSSLPPSNDVILSNNPSYVAVGRWLRSFPISGVSIDAIARNAGTGTNIGLFGNTFISNALITEGTVDPSGNFHLGYNMLTSFLAGNTDNAASLQAVADQSPVVVATVTDLLSIQRPVLGKYATVTTGSYAGTWQFCPDELAADNGGNIRRPTDIVTDADAGRWMFITATATDKTVDSVASLVLLDPNIFSSTVASTNTTFGALVTVQGRTTAGDGGDGQLRWNSSSTSTTNGGYRFAAPYGASTGRWERLRIRGEGKLSWWPITLNTITTDNSPQIQSAARSLYDEEGGGVLEFPAGIISYGSQILWPSRVSIRGKSRYIPQDTLYDELMTNVVNAVTNYTLFGNTVMFAITNSNCKLFVFDTNRAVIANLHSPDTIQGQILNKYAANLSISGLTVFGNNIYQDNYNLDPFYFPNCWDLNFHDINIVRHRGYAFNVFNCNGLVIKDFAIFGSSFYGSKGVGLFNCSDFEIYSFYIFGGRGPAFWISGSDGWLGSIQGPGLCGNFDGYGWREVTSVSANVFTTSTNHQFQTGDPIILERVNQTDTMPTGVGEGDTYWVTKLSDNTFSLTTNGFPAAVSPGALIATNLPTTIYVGPGWASGVYANFGANSLSVGGFRCDQTYDNGVVMEGASRNAFSGMIIREVGVTTGSGTVTPRAGTNVAGVLLKTSTTFGNAENKWTGGTFKSLTYPFQINTSVSDFSPVNVAIDFSTVPENRNLYANTGTARLNYLEVGDHSAATAMRLLNSGFEDVLRVNRDGLTEWSFRSSASGTDPFVFLWDYTNNRAIATMFGSATIPYVRTGSSSAQASPRAGGFAGGEHATGTDIAGGDTIIDSGRGTGNNGLMAKIDFRSPLNLSTGTTLQTLQDSLYIGWPATFSIYDSPLTLFYTPDGTTTSSGRIQRHANGILAAGTYLGDGQQTYVMASIGMGGSLKYGVMGGDLFGDNTTSYTMVDGSARFLPVYINSSRSITGVCFVVQTAGSFTGDNSNVVGLFTYNSGTGAVVMVATSADDQNIWKTQNTWVKVPFTGTYTPNEGLHFIGILYNSSAEVTAPVLRANAIPTAAIQYTQDFPNSGKLYSILAAQTNLPSSTTMAGLTSNSSIPWVGLY